MSNQLHTPGPWAIAGEYSNNQDEIEAADGRAVAVVWTRSAPERATARPQFVETEEGVANARLIAAAPELLECLIHLMDRDWFKDIRHDGEVICGLDADKVRAALRKATGKETP